jgi:DNA-binding NtrC family response regulator
MPDTDDLPSDCIIVADSEVIIRNVIADYLRRCGYKVIDAANADEVIMVLESGFATVNAILCDAALAGTMNAFALRLSVRERWPDIHVILAGNVTAAAQAAGQLCEEGPHLARPYDPQTVLSHIKRLLGIARK